MIVLITGTFPVYKQGIKVGTEFVVSHGIDLDTDRHVILPCEHPSRIEGAKMHPELGWVIED
jgi:hypothetical protein